MALFLSPGVVTLEQEAGTLSTREKSDKIAALAGAFQWGPVDEPTFVSGGEADFVARFGIPNDATAKYGMVALDFLSYAKSMWIVRQVGDAALNAFPSGLTPTLIKNDNDFVEANLSGTDFIAKYAGTLGNDLTVDIVDSAGFDAWEYANQFSYKPQPGEFSIAVIDASGVWSGAGANRQKERLIASGTVLGGVQQKQTLTMSGTAAGGTKQEEILTFSGLATGTSIIVGGTNVTIVAGDSATVVAGKVAAALAAVPATYQSAVATNNTVRIVFATPTTGQAAVVGATTNGITFTSVIVIAGSANFVATIYGENVTLENGDTAVEVAGKVYNVFAGKVSLYSAVSQPTTAKVQYTHVAYGPKSTSASDVVAGITVATAVDIIGSANVNLSVLGQTVAVLNGDTAAQVAAKIAAHSGFAALFDSVSAFSTAVTYTLEASGRAEKQVAPAAQFGLTFRTEISDIGRSGTILEKYEIMNNTPGSANSDGTTKFWYDAINRSSLFIRAGDKTLPLSARRIVLTGGVDDNDINVIDGYSKFVNKEAYELQFLLSPAVSVAEQMYIIDVADTRGDCMAFVAPMIEDVVNNRQGERAAVTDWRQNRLNKDSTYTFVVDNWGYMYDKYNDVFRWVPATGGTAGLAARCFVEAEAWISFAGFQRGRYKNYVKMAWSASEEDRNQMYKTGINSIVTFPGQGIVLFGDKTATSRPTAFGHVNVRWAFVVAKLSLADMAKYFLFELNDEYTRAQFANAARPFLRNMKSRKAFQDFKVIIDETNNGGQVQAENKMVAQVLVKPLYSINWVVLNMTAVRPDVSFTEVELQN
jgi:hypothetical protein